MSKCFKAEDVVLELVGENEVSVICEMVRMSDWKVGTLGTLANE